MKMYNNNNVNANNHNISIDGYTLIADEITPNESFNRRETSRHDIIGGTQSVIRTNYIVRDYTFTTHVMIDPLYPDVYDDTFKLWMSKPCEVISREMGGKFNAEIIVKKTHESPNYLSLEIQVIEIPNKTNIPNDDFIIPPTKIVKVKTKTNNKTSKIKTSKKNTKSSKNTKKGSKITKVQK